MPRIPILPPPGDVSSSGGAGTGDGPETLPPEAAAGLRRLEARTARIDEGLAVSQSWLSAVDRLAQAADAPEGPSPGFTRSFLEETDRDRQAAVDGLPPDRRVGLDQALLGLRADFAGRAAAVEADGLALRRPLGLYRTLDGYRAGVTQDPGLYDDAAGRMAGLVASLELPEDRRRALDDHVKDALGNAAVDGLMQEPARAERMLSAGLFDDALSHASKAARLKQAQDLVARQSLLDRERTLSNLTAQADAGTALDATIGAAQKSRTVTNAEADQLRSRNADAAQAAARREANVRRVASSSKPLDPSNSEDRAAVSDYWDRVSEAYAQDDAATQRKAELGFVQRTGVLPDGLRRKYQGALLSADPAVAVSGAQAIEALVQQDPALVSDIPADQRRRAQAIARYAALDLPPDRAVLLAEKDAGKSTTEPSGAGSGSKFRLSSPATEGTDSGRPTEAQIAQVEDAPSPPPSWDDVHDLEKRLQEDGEEAFTAEARKAGLDPERVRLFIDILKATPADRDAIIGRIRSLYGRMGALFLQDQLDKFINYGDVEDRKKALDDHRQDLLAGAREREARQEQAYDLFRGVIGGFGRKKARPGPQARKPKFVGKLPPGPGFKPNRKFITPDEFLKLPDKGFIDPQSVRTSQDSFSRFFKEEYIKGQGKVRRTVEQLTAEVKAGKEKNVRPIRLVEWEGYVYSPDHRRLVAYRRAGKDIPYVKIPYGQLDENAQKRIRKAKQLNNNGTYIINRDERMME